ncbi:hypothetical protein [Roseospirillum parvum]|uniref:GDSL-like Lipase/Acylhydrolase family protein n=1 Tax=Roseospirillum parvum TaxID=83401 RepID=A0A1G8E4F9_9PROT|nr:hypothetical protein [Roseospirillum parvum]SDH64826.1 hypothetical protein SAMN05421742_10933 [Roseospirillum parvum]
MASSSTSSSSRRLPWRRIALLAALLVVGDQLLGRLVEAALWTTDSNWGPNQAVRLLKRDEPGLILGDSRAGAILPATLEAATGVAFFNGTAPGQTAHYQAIMLERLLARHPGLEVIVYEIDHIDLQRRPETAGGFPVEVAGFLYHDSPTARRVLHHVDPWNRLRHLSRTYGVNGALAPILVDRLARHLKPDLNNRLTTADGHYTRPGTVDTSACAPTPPATVDLDPFKLALIEDMVAAARAHGVRLVFVTAPLLLACSIDQGPVFAAFAERAARWGVPYHDFHRRLQDGRWFYDNNHLNHQGAALYSELIAEALKRPG